LQNKWGSPNLRQNGLDVVNLSESHVEDIAVLFYFLSCCTCKKKVEQKLKNAWNKISNNTSKLNASNIEKFKDAWNKSSNKGSKMRASNRNCDKDARIQ
jgi:hypothetical protein